MSITNIVLALSISTVELTEVPCPDNIPGCCVFHAQYVTNTTLRPYQWRESESMERGIAYGIDEMVRALRWSYGSLTNMPPVIPVKLFQGEISHPHAIDSIHPVGFLFRDTVLHSIINKSEVKK